MDTNQTKNSPGWRRRAIRVAGLSLAGAVLGLGISLPVGSTLAQDLTAGQLPGMQAPQNVQPASFSAVPLGPPGLNPPAAQQKIDAFIADVKETEAKMEVSMMRSKLVRTHLPVARVSLVDPSVVEIVQYGPQEFELIGRKPGLTTMTLWFAQQDPAQPTPVLRLDVTVVRDNRDPDARQLEYGELQQMVNEMFPNSMVYLIPVADKLIVKGQARDSEEATQIMSLLSGQASNGNGQVLTGVLGPVGGLAASPFPDSQLPSSRIVSLLEVPGEQQVMLKVRIAELNRSAAREMGVTFEVFGNDTSWVASLLSGAPNVTALLTTADVNLFLKAFSSNGVSKILAEPNLVVLNGRTASFIAGGEFAVPTVVGVGGAQAATTQFRGFGTQLTFTPTIIDKDRIRLQVSPEFSALDAGNSVNGIPGLRTRATNTTVDLREGQWLAIAGLLQEDQTGSNGRIPILGDIPVVRTVFSNKTVNKGETELIVLVSPELVHPMEAEEMPPLLPGMEVTEPDGWHFFIGGHIEGDPNCHHRQTVWPMYADAIHKAKKHGHYQESEQFYFSGPHGFSE